MVPVRAVFFFALFAVAAAAAEPPKHPPDLEAIAVAAGSAPAEFHADALLRLAESGKVADPAWKREMIEEAFAVTASARTPVPVRSVRAGRTASGPALDRLSLQVRAVNLMRSIDGRKARAMFAEVSKPSPRELECTDATWDDVSAWYSAAAHLVGTFSPAERRRQDHLNFAVSAIASVVSVTEVAPAQAMLTVPDWRPDETDFLGAKFAAVIEQLNPGNRTFSAAEAEARQAIDKLVASGYDGTLMRGAWSRLVDRQQSVEKCPAVSQVTAALGGMQMASTPPSDPQASRLASHWMNLMFGTKQQSLTDAEKNTQAWRDSLAAYLTEIDELKADTPEGELEVYQMKTEALGGLLIAVPPGADRDRIRARYVETLAASPVEAQNPGRWLTAVKQLLDSAAAAPAEIRKLFDAFESTGNPALVLYARLERTLPQTLFKSPSTVP